MNAYHELEGLDMQEWEDLCQHQPISSRDMEALVEDIMSEVDKSCIAAYNPSQKKKKDFICSHCQKQFTRKFDLSRHMKKHTQEKGYGCDLCPRTFYLRDKLRQHRIICQRKAASDERVEKQLNSRRVMVDDGSVDGNVSTYQRWSKAFKRFVCTRCNKPFTRKFDLQRHMKMHARGKEFQCGICHKTFHRKDKKIEHELCCRKGRIAEDADGNSLQDTAQSGGGHSSDSEETVENDGCESAINGNLKTIHMKPRVQEKYDLSLFLQGKRANVLKNLEKEFKEKEV